MTVDYTNAQNQYDLSRAMFAGNQRPVQGAGPLDSLARILAAHFNAKNMRGAQHGMERAETDQLNLQKTDMARALSALHENPQYKPSPDELMPDEQPIQGLEMQGTGNNRQAMVESLMTAQTPWANKLGMQAMLAQPEQDKKTALISNLIAAGYQPGTPEFKAMVDQYITKPAGGDVSIMNRTDPVPQPGYKNEYDANGNLVRQVLIKDSPQEKAEVAATEQANLNEAATDLKREEFLGQIDKALANNTFWTTGMVGKVLTYWSSSDARYQEKLLERIQGEVALDRLAQAQAASKTGGVFGSLQKAELDLLKNSLEALEVGMAEDKMEEGLLGIKEHRLKWDGYQELWNDPEWTGMMLKESERMAKFGDYVPEKDGVEILNAQGKIIGYYR